MSVSIWNAASGFISSPRNPIDILQDCSMLQTKHSMWEWWLKLTSKAHMRAELNDSIDTLQADGVWALQARLPVLASLMYKTGISYCADNFLRCSLTAGGHPRCIGGTVFWCASNLLIDMLGWCLHTEGKALLQKEGTCTRFCYTVWEPLCYQMYQVSLDPSEFCV